MAKGTKMQSAMLYTERKKEKGKGPDLRASSLRENMRP